ncbi:MAG TPA: hypothetical protein PKN38_02595 [Taishania sp.]|nr:hypothetical protein [Taishania sp.]
MKRFIKIIAESGGTKTDWLAKDESGQFITFTTVSYHPANVNEAFIATQKKIWEQYDLSQADLHFYGSGCLQVAKQEEMKQVFRQLGFCNAISVQSDLFAALDAVNGASEMVAICGTGSVVFKIENNQVVELRGGLGWEKGDEGSGFYFGKLLLNALKSENRYPEIVQSIEQWKPLEELWSMENTVASKTNYAQLSSLLSDFHNHPFVASIHQENCRLFFENYCQNCSSISLVGSYAFYLQSFFMQEAAKRNITIEKLVKRPLENLSKQLI